MDNADSTNNFKSLFDNQSSNNSEDGSSESRQASRVAASNTQMLKDINENLKKLVNMSQGEAQSKSNSSKDWRNTGNDDSKNKKKAKIDTKSFSDGVEEALLDALGASGLKNDLKAALQAFSTDVGLEIKDIPYQFGKELTDSVFSTLSNTKLGSHFGNKFDNWSKEAHKSFFEAAFASYAKDTGRSVAEIQDLVNQAKQQYKSESPSERQYTADSASNIKDALGDEIQDSLTDKIIDTLKDSGINTDKVSRVRDKASDFSNKAKEAGSDFAGRVKAKSSALADNAMGKFKDSTAGKVAGTVGEHVSGKVSGLVNNAVGGKPTMALAKSVTAGLKAVPGLGKALLVTSAIEILTDGVMKSFADVTEKFDAFTGALGNASDRDQNSRLKMQENANKRLTDDLEAILDSEFDILKDASDRMISVWEDNLKVINQTQGYSKADLQDLISSYATRIREEGLSSVVSVSDFTSNLGSVLQAGLSGEVAEEFAYLATKLNAAIPTQDFFSYSETYASLIGNAIKDGQSQSEAIQYANEQLETFASEVLYASRQLSGGLNVGLQNASDLFTKATQISVAAKTGDPSQIAGVLTSVSAITGAIAPDLADSIVSAIYDAATGGNSSSLVALRSLAGINASNTEFLQKFAEDPQSVFSTLFTNLANMQNMSESNYMEVAEGLSNVFGISMDALSRVDFNYLAQAIDSMNVSTASLDENYTQLASGESTLSAEQMRIQQINQYMIDEGLSYVLDNEAARSIQENMWAEQRANAIMENQYSVDLQGSAFNLLESLHNLGQNIFELLLPVVGVARKVTNLAQTVIDVQENNEKIQKILEAGKVGDGNSEVLSNLITRGKDLKLTNSYLSELIQVKSTSGSSGYTWGTIGKSQYSALGTKALGSNISANWAGGSLSSSDISNSVNVAKLQQNFNKMLSSMSDYYATTVNDKVESAIEKTTSTLTAQKITEADILKRANEYLADPEKYGIGISNYASKLASSAIGDQFDTDVAARSLEIAKQRAKADLENELKSSSLLEATSDVLQQAVSGVFGQSGYNAWVESASKFGISDFEEALTELGYSATDVENYFNSLETQLAAVESEKRNKTEEEFWSNSQEYLDLINTNIHDVFDKGDMMGVVWPGLDAWLNDIDSAGTSGGSGFRADMYERLTTVNDSIITFRVSMEEQWTEFRTDWTDYYIKHTTYNSHLLGEDKSDGQELLATLDKVKSEEGKNTEDVLNALTEAMMENPIGDLLDPTVQQNMFLAAILQGVQAIIQQNNTQGKLKLPDAIAALATGMTTTTTTS